MRFPYRYNVWYITSQFQIHFCSGGGGGRIYPFVEVTVNRKEEKSTFVPITSKNSASEVEFLKIGEKVAENLLF